MAGLFSTPSYLNEVQIPSSFPSPEDSVKFQAFSNRHDYVWQGDLPSLFAGIFEFSPYLTRLIEKNTAFLFEAQGADIHSLCQDIFTEIRNWDYADEAAFMAALRQAKAKIALLTALADIGGQWTLEQVTDILSRFADICCSAALECAWSYYEARGDLKGTVQGYFALALGKLGGYELNYSSDIDLVILFDERQLPYTGRKSPGDCAVRLTKKLVSLLQDRTEDGYVFRVDLRLRPDPGATAVAVSIQAAEIYYQSLAQTWERSAYIKARYICGDESCAQDFLEIMRPFIWRRHLDFAAIDDIHAMKARVHEHHAHKSINCAGHDVKLGIGGIREIEFFAQIHQLITGGRRADLQVRPTLKTLKALQDAGDISNQIYDDLKSAYVFFRTVEHRLQMVDDQQTHHIPTQEEDLQSISQFLGFSGTKAFEEEITSFLKQTHAHYEAFLPSQSSTSPSIASIKKKFPDDQLVDDLIERWRNGRYRALRTARSQQLLEAVLGDLLQAFADTTHPDHSLKRFDSFLSQLPSGVQLFSLFKTNPRLLTLISNIMGQAPALADQLSRRPALLESFLSADFFSDVPETEMLCDDLKSYLRLGQGYEDVLDRARIWLNERRFQLGVLMLEQLLDPISAARSLSRLADACVKTLLPAVEDEFSRSAGRIKDGVFAVMAMGGYGAHALTYSSDLDLVFLYDCPDGAQSEDGRRAFSASQYYSNLSQRLISALSVMTAEGRLFEIDMRLRPSGRAGIIAVSLNAFENYQNEEAWSWEHMSLTKARLITASSGLVEKFEKRLSHIIAQTHPEAKLKTDMRAMRQRYDEEFKDNSLWALMTTPGGLSDANWVVQLLLLSHGLAALNKTEFPRQLQDLGNKDILRAHEVQRLETAWKILFQARALKRLLLGSSKSIEEAEELTKLSLAKLLGHANFNESCKAIAQAKKDVAEIFEKYIGYPKRAEQSDETE